MCVSHAKAFNAQFFPSHVLVCVVFALSQPVGAHGPSHTQGPQGQLCTNVPRGLLFGAVLCCSACSFPALPGAEWTTGVLAGPTHPAKVKGKASTMSTLLQEPSHLLASRFTNLLFNTLMDS